MTRTLALIGILALTVCGARADEYWIAYEGNDFPENEGWQRITGPLGGAQRSLENGSLVLDSRASIEIVDFYRRHMNGQLDPDPGELFMTQWRLKIDELTGRADPTLGVASDDNWTVAFQFGEDTIFSTFEHGVSAPFEAGVFHEFELRSWDMRDYELYIDGKLAISGSFRLTPSIWSRVSWGDGIQGGASLARWDYVRFGVVPEPATGDLNCDGAFNGADIDPFFLAVGDPEEYERRFPDCNILNGDLNGDGAVNGADIDPFFECLGTGGCP